MPESPTRSFSLFRFSHLTGLQLFQLVRYATFVVAGIGFAKLHLPPSEIGHYETFIMVSGMVSFFWVSGIINSMLAVYPKLEGTQQQQVFFNTFLSLLGFGVVAGALLYIFSDNLLSFIDKQGGGSFIGWVVLYLLLNSPAFLIEYILYLNQRKEAILYYAGLSSFFTLGVILLPVAFHFDIQYSFFGLIGLALIKIIALLFLINRFGSFQFNPRLQLANLRLSLPLMLSIFISGSAEYIDSLIVKAKFDNVAFAVYRYGAKELPVLLIVANTFSAAMIPAISANLKEGLAEIKRRSARLMHLFFPLSIVLMLVSHHLYLYVFNESFIYSAFIFNIYLLLIIPRLLFPQTVLMGMQHSKFLLISSVFEIAINVSLSVWLAGIAGLPGIALGTFVAYTFDKVFLITVCRFRYGIALSDYISLLPFFVYSLLLLCAFAGGYWISVQF